MRKRMMVGEHEYQKSTMRVLEAAEGNDGTLYCVQLESKIATSTRRHSSVNRRVCMRGNKAAIKFPHNR